MQNDSLRNKECWRLRYNDFSRTFHTMCTTTSCTL